MFHFRREGQRVKPGVNITRTAYGHVVLLVVAWGTERWATGYYWGKNFNWWNLHWDTDQQPWQ